MINITILILIVILQLIILIGIWRKWPYSGIAALLGAVIGVCFLIGIVIHAVGLIE